MLFLKKQQENDLLPKARTRFSVDLIFLQLFFSQSKIVREKETKI